MRDFRRGIRDTPRRATGWERDRPQPDEAPEPFWFNHSGGHHDFDGFAYNDGDADEHNAMDDQGSEMDDGWGETLV